MQAIRVKQVQTMGRLAGIARRDAKRAPMQTLDQAVISEAHGVADDFRGKPGKRQVTVISSGAWRAACRELGQDVPWTTRRANLLVDGIDLPSRAGDTLQIGGVRLRINGETEPCTRMDEQFEGLKRALTPDWRGGVFCTVVGEGSVSLGDEVSLHLATD